MLTILIAFQLLTYLYFWLVTICYMVYVKGGDYDVTCFEFKNTVFASGWLQGEDVWGRPVDIKELPDGSLLVTDDFVGAVYRITYGG